MVESPTIESTVSHFVMRFLFIFSGGQVLEAALLSRTQRLEQMLMDVEPRVNLFFKSGHSGIVTLQNLGMQTFN